MWGWIGGNKGDSSGKFVGIFCIFFCSQFAEMIVCDLVIAERPNDQFAVMMAASDERFRQEYRVSITERSI